MTVISNQHLKQFEQQGYVVVKGLLDINKDIQPVREEYMSKVEELEKQWYDKGIISKYYNKLPFEKRLGQLVIDTEGKLLPFLDIALKSKDLGTQHPNIHHGPAVFGLLANPKVLDAVERFIGPEIYVNPLNRLRIKPPERLLPEDLRKMDQISKTFWHQDQGVVREDADDTDLLTVWIPLTNATPENGCLAVMPGSHKDGLKLHCFTEWREKGIRSDLLQDFIPMPMKPGDVYFQNKFTVHGSVSNSSKDDVRISFDLRYQPIGQPTGVPVGPPTPKPVDVSQEPLKWPGFVARSLKNPESVLTDNEEWGRIWAKTREDIISMRAHVKTNRWDPFDPDCAPNTD